MLPDEFLDAESFAQQRIDRWRMWTWADALAHSQVFVPVLDGRVVGFGHCGPERVAPVCDQSGTAEPATVTLERGEVYGFYLHPSAWGSGAATPLMERCHQHLVDAGHRSAVLWVLRDNPRARGFYEKAGWRPTGRKMMFTGPTSVALPPFELPEVEYTRNFD